MTLFTASEAERVEACPASAQGILPRARETSTYADRGTGFDWWVKRAAAGDARELLDELDEGARELAEHVLDEGLLDELPVDPHHLVADVAFALDVDTGEARELGRGTGRDYSGATDSDVAGEVDLVGMLEADGVYVPDLKTGWTNRKPPGLQLEIYGLAAARAYGRDRAIVEIVWIEVGRRPWRSAVELDSIDLGAVAGRLESIAERVRAARERYEAGRGVDVNIGEHCRFCPARFVSCPGHLEAARAFALEVERRDGAEVEGPSIVPARPQALSPALAGEVYTMAKAAGAVALKVIDIVESMVAEGIEVPLPDGRILSEVEEPGKRRLDAPTVREVVVERLGDEAAAGLDVSITFKALAEIAKQYANGSPASQLERELIGAITAAGGIEQPTRTTIKALRPAEAQL